MTNMDLLTLERAVCSSPAQHVIDDVTLQKTEAAAEASVSCPLSVVGIARFIYYPEANSHPIVKR